MPDEFFGQRPGGDTVRGPRDDHPVVVWNLCDVKGTVLYSFLGIQRKAHSLQEFPARTGEVGDPFQRCAPLSVPAGNFAGKRTPYRAAFRCLYLRLRAKCPQRLHELKAAVTLSD
jgi:hypothetical protein